MKYPVLIVYILLLATAAAHSQAAEYAIDEHFQDLNDWRPIVFPRIKRHSEYFLAENGGGNMLVAQSDASASGLRHVKEFNVYDFPVMRWRWKVDSVIAGGNLEEKAGDDYPIRVYVMFKYDPEKASFGEKIEYGLARLLYGEYPPGSGLNYIWANREHEKRIYPSPYTDRSMMVILRAGSGQAGMWLEEQVNIVDDYRRAFHEQPPETASIAVMNDSDNTGGSARSYLDFLQVLHSE